MVAVNRTACGHLTLDLHAILRAGRTKCTAQLIYLVKIHCVERPLCFKMALKRVTNYQIYVRQDILWVYRISDRLTTFESNVFHQIFVKFYEH